MTALSPFSSPARTHVRLRAAAHRRVSLRPIAQGNRPRRTRRPRPDTRAGARPVRAVAGRHRRRGTRAGTGRPAAHRRAAHLQRRAQAGQPDAAGGADAGPRGHPGVDPRPARLRQPRQPFELFEALGLAVSGDVEDASRRLASERLAILPTAAIHAGLDAMMALRPRLGLRNSSHSVAKLLDPLPGRSVRVVAVTHPEYVDSMGQALPVLSADGGRALLMRASEGEAYLHLRRKAHLQGFADGAATDLQPERNEDLDWPLSTACEPGENAALIREILAGAQTMPPRIADQISALRRLATG
ncbi:hypothetical protein Ddc_23910 [Ditylenchus destructor]|nr:hypothetical protein Ddc_23910 [Ditylenchus destructor]